MRRLVLLLALLFATPAQAEITFLGVGVAHAQMGAAAPSFTGVADIDTSVVHFWGLVAASKAAATAGTAVANLTNNTTTCTGIKVLATGMLDVSVGLYCNGGTQTVTTWCSTNCVVGGSAHISQLTDQIAGGVNCTQATYGSQPGFVLVGVNNQPTISSTAGSSTMACTITNVGPPWSLGFTGERTSNFTAFSASATQVTQGYVGWENVANTTECVSSGAGVSIFPSGQTDGTSTSDFSHFLTNVMVIQAGTCYCYPAAGAAAQTATGGSVGTSTAVTLVGGTPAFLTKMWIGSAVLSAANGQALTSLPFP